MVERFGEELDQELMYGTKTIEVEETVKNEDGTEQTVKKTKQVIGNPLNSEHAFLWYDGDKGFTGSPFHDRVTVQQIQDHLNRLLEKRGHVMLNECRELFGKPATREGYKIGWIYDPNVISKISFGIFERANAGDQAARNFLDGDQGEVLIDPNVDGYIIDLI